MKENITNASGLPQPLKVSLRYYSTVATVTPSGNYSIVKIQFPYISQDSLRTSGHILDCLQRGTSLYLIYFKVLCVVTKSEKSQLPEAHYSVCQNDKGSDVLSFWQLKTESIPTTCLHYA